LRNSENSESPEVKDQIKLLEDNKINITLKTNNKNPFFTFKNYAIPTILELIKQGNLDKELLTYINTEVDSILSPIKAKLRNIVVSDKELLDFLMDFEKNMELPITIMSEYFEGYLGEELKEETLKDLPK
jgi:hypothetical protein